MSYDYYLSEDRPREQIIADLRELTRLNSERPYFLLLHVRQRSTVEQVKGILDALGPGFEVVPLDVFLTMAASAPTFDAPRHLPPGHEAPAGRRPTSSGLPDSSK